MLITLWSVKGGSGVSVVAAGLAALLGARADARSGGPDGGTLLVDLADDQPALLGVAEPVGPGVLDWLATPTGDAAALRRLERDAGTGIRLLPRGGGEGPVAASSSVDDQRVIDLVSLLHGERRQVIVDGGLGAWPTPALASAGLSLVVVRPCYLALRRAVRRGITADGVVLVADAGRALDARDVSRALGLPVLCTVDADPSVARAVDAGLLATRLPRSFARSLGAIA